MKNAESSRMPLEFPTGVTLPEYFSTTLDMSASGCAYICIHIIADNPGPSP